MGTWLGGGGTMRCTYSKDLIQDDRRDRRDEWDNVRKIHCCQYHFSDKIQFISITLSLRSLSTFKPYVLVKHFIVQSYCFKLTQECFHTSNADISLNQIYEKENIWLMSISWPSYRSTYRKHFSYTSYKDKASAVWIKCSTKLITIC